MEIDKKIKILKKDIEVQREKLNKIVIENKSKDEIIRISEDLDILINKYYSIDLDKKIAE